MNRIGDLGLFTGNILDIVGKLGTATYSEVFDLRNTLSETDITAITLLLFVGTCGKVHKFPVHGCRMRWQARHQYLH